MGATIISLSNQIGGTGKTTVAFHLAHGLSRMGFKVLAMDLDPKASLTRALGIPSHLITFSSRDIMVKSTTWWKAVQFVRPSLYHIPATQELSGTDYHLLTKPFSYMQLKKKLNPARKEHDFIVIDTPPAFNLCTVNAWNVSDLVLMPFLPGPMLGRDLMRTLREFREFDVDVQVLFNQVTRKNHHHVTAAIALLEQHFRTPYFKGTIIGRSSLIQEAMARAVPVFDPFPHTTISQTFRKLSLQLSASITRTNEN